MSAATASARPPQIDAPQRLSATLVLSGLVHAAIVLGIGFAVEDAAPVVPTLDVILTRTSTPLTPQQADFLAQADNQGGGEHDRAGRPGDTQAGLDPSAREGLAPQPLSAQAPPPTPPQQDRVITSTRGEEAASTPQPRPQLEPVPLPESQRKVEHDMEMARLAAEIQLRSENYAKRPKREFISASTRRYEYAQYMRGWVDRVERIGNLNYPEEARRRRIGGLVVISVAVRRDGSVEGTQIIQSSRIPMLDAAAERIVQLSQPFEPLPRTTENPDVLHITRTWQFLPGGEMVDR